MNQNKLKNNSYLRFYQITIKPISLFSLAKISHSHLTVISSYIGIYFFWYPKIMKFIEAYLLTKKFIDWLRKFSLKYILVTYLKYIQMLCSSASSVLMSTCFFDLKLELITLSTLKIEDT